MVNYITKIMLFFICIQICFSKNDYILINLITTNDIHGVISEQSAIIICDHMSYISNFLIKVLSILIFNFCAKKLKISLYNIFI